MFPDYLSILMAMLEVSKAVKNLQSSTLRLVYLDLGNPESYCLPSGASQGVQIVFLCGNNRTVPITWKSKKLERVTKSPMASEAMALVKSADAGHFVALIRKEIFGLKTAPRVFCKTGNKCLKEHLKNSKVIQDLRLREDIGRLRVGEIR